MANKRNYGQISNMIKALELAFDESKGHLSKTIQAELNDGLKELVQLVTNSLNDSIENMSDDQSEHCDNELERIYKKI